VCVLLMLILCYWH